MTASMPTLVAMSLFWWTACLLVVAGLSIVVWTIRKRRGWWWKIALALVLLFGPYLFDVARCRVTLGGESWLTAPLPTTLLLPLMTPDTQWPYGIVFNRLHRAPRRHAMWGWQLDQFAGWCDRCVASSDPAMVKRGVQIAGTLAGRDCDVAVLTLGRATLSKDRESALLACDTLAGLGDRAAAALAELHKAAQENPHEEIQRRAAELTRSLRSLSTQDE